MSLTIIRTLSMRVRKLGSIFAVTVLLCGPAAQAATVAEPVFTAPHYGDKELSAGVTFSGRADPSSAVDISIDGERAGRVQFAATSTPEAPFTFTAPEPLAPGYHYVEAKAHDPAGQKEARQSLWWLFHVRDALPAPVVRSIVERAGKEFIIAGVVKSGHQVRVYLDGQAKFTSDVFVHSSGTAGFSVRLAAVPAGEHVVAVTAVRPDGAESKHSEPQSAMMTGTVAQAPVVPTPPKPVVPKPASTTSPVAASPTPTPSPVPTAAATPQPPAPVVSVAPSPAPIMVQPGSTGTPSVIVVPAQGDINDATSTASEDEASVPDSTAQRQRIALAILGLLLVALIIWYATRREGGGTEGTPPSETPPQAAPPASSPPSSPLSGTLPPAVSQSSSQPQASYGMPASPERERGERPRGQTSEAVDEIIPPPPPPPPNFATRMDQY